MSSPSTLELRKRDVALRARYARGISIVFSIVFLSTLGLYLYLALSDNRWQFYILSGTAAIVSLLSLLAIRFSQQKRVDVAVALMIGGIALLFPVATSLISGIGLVLGIGGLIGIFMIASLTLEQPQLTWANIAGAILSVVVILLDLFYPFDRLEVRALQVYVPVAAVAGLAVFVYFIIQEFTNYPLRTKLVMSFVAIAIISMGALGYIVNRTNSARLTQDVGEKLSAQGGSYALIVGELLVKEISNLQTLGLSQVVQDRVESASNGYIGDEETIHNAILALDHQWREADAKNNNQDPLVASVLGEGISSELREYRRAFPENVEVFVTDKYGAVVASTNRTSDYYQADETWWQTAYNDGEGAIYISDPEFDESSSAYASLIAVPLYAHDSKQIVGVLRTTLDINSITTTLNFYRLGRTGRIELYVADGQKIPLTGGGLVPGDPIAISLPTDASTFSQIVYENAPSFVSRSRVTSLNTQYAGPLETLGWSVVIHQDQKEALAPVAEQTRTIILISMLLLGLAAIAAFYASQILARPVQSLTTVAQKITSGDLQARASITTQDEIGTLASAFNKMTDQLNQTLTGLEQRVLERTQDLELARIQSETRAQELQSISEISRTISSEQRTEILLPLITRLISERFDFYHVGIFLLDHTRQFAVLQAANSEGGRQMLENGYRLEVGQTGIVGNVAASGKPRIALDVGADSVFFDNPYLPKTRSEMALPLNIRGETIGVLDVQSTVPGAFTENTANNISILADQVAIAIENSRLFTQSQQARHEMEALYNQYLRREWSSVDQQDGKIGYRQSIVGGRALDKPLESDEIVSALKNGQVVVTEGQGGRSNPSITIPVRLRGQTIGVLNIKAPTKNRRWSQDEIGLAQAVSDRLALALDNARLLQESQRRAAKEAKIGEVTAKIGASINMQNVLQTAVEELGRALPGSEVIIQFNKEQG